MTREDYEANCRVALSVLDKLEEEHPGKPAIGSVIRLLMDELADGGDA